MSNITLNRYCLYVVARGGKVFVEIIVDRIARRNEELDRVNLKNRETLEHDEFRKLIESVFITLEG